MSKTQKPPTGKVAPARDFDDEIRKRIAQFVKTVSQAEVSRRTGATRSSVNRYMKGATIPAEFLGQLCDAFQLSPAWLLTGAGAQAQAEVGPKTAKVAADMLELVNAMNAVARMRLGAIAGQERAQMLRKLGDQLELYASLRDKLNAQLREILATVLADLESVAGTKDEQRARSLLRSAEELLRLCPDSQAETHLLGLRAAIESATGNLKLSAKLRGEHFSRVLTNPDVPIAGRLGATLNYAFDLRRIGRLQDALHICNAALALFPNAAGTREHVHLIFMASMLEGNKGNFRKALDMRIEAMRSIPAEARKEFHFRMQISLVMAGVLTIDDLFEEHKRRSTPPTTNEGHSMLAVATFMADSVRLKRFLDFYAKSQASLDYFESRHVLEFARSLVDVAHGRGTKVLVKFREFLAETESEWKTNQVFEFAVHASLGFVAARAEDRSTTDAAIRACERLLESMPDGAYIPNATEAIHYHNVISHCGRAIPKPGSVLSQHAAAFERAMEFFPRHYELGCAIYRPYVEWIRMIEKQEKE